ncbi:roadblock/LC7 domain-containing protein [Streptomyces sp. URMC 123]|uniref:roadblock/LC7 domain-containing protein n=1 Tax=Streptomyces sp. URMC 123 TaxID=3423403 RepID=UPI003F1C9FF0
MPGPEPRGTDAYGLSSQAQDLHWLLTNLVDEVPGVRSVAVVSSDGLLLLSSDPRDEEVAVAGQPMAGPPADHLTAGQPLSAVRRRGAMRAGAGPRGPRGSTADLATIVSGLASLTGGAAHLMDGGAVKQTMVAMDEGCLFVMSISDGSLLGVLTAPDCDMTSVAYHMGLFVGRAGHVLTPELRGELRRSAQRHA